MHDAPVVVFDERRERERAKTPKTDKDYEHMLISTAAAAAAWPSFCVSRRNRVVREEQDKSGRKIMGIFHDTDGKLMND